MGTSRACIEACLQKDYPNVYQRYVNGEIRSARAAGIEAGFIKDSYDPEMAVRRAWKQLKPSRRTKFKNRLKDAKQVVRRKK